MYVRMCLSNYQTGTVRGKYMLEFHPEPSHPGVYETVLVNPSNSPSMAARGDKSRISEQLCDTILEAKPRELERTASSISGEGFDVINPGFGHSTKVIDVWQKADKVENICLPVQIQPLGRTDPRHHILFTKCDDYRGEA